MKAGLCYLLILTVVGKQFLVSVARDYNHYVEKADV